MIAARARLCLTAIAAAFILTVPLVSAWHPCCLALVGTVAGRPENLPLWVARNKGFFDPARLRTEVAEYKTTAEMVNELQTRKLDIAYAAALVPVVRAGRGEVAVKVSDFQVIASVVNVPLYYIVTADVPTAVEKLAGGSIGILRGDDVGRHVLMRALAATKASPTPGGVKELGDSAELESALRSRAVAAVAVPPEVALRLERKGFTATVLNRLGEPPVAVYGVVTTSNWVKNHAADDPRFPELITGLMKAHAFIANPSYREQVVQILRDRLSVDEKLAERMYRDFVGTQRYFAPTAEPNAKALDELVAILASAGRVPRRDELKDLIDLTPFRRAMERK